MSCQSPLRTTRTGISNLPCAYVHLPGVRPQLARLCVRDRTCGPRSWAARLMTRLVWRLSPNVAVLDAFDQGLWFELAIPWRYSEQNRRLRLQPNVFQGDRSPIFRSQLHRKLKIAIDPTLSRRLIRGYHVVFEGTAPIDDLGIDAGAAPVAAGVGHSRISRRRLPIRARINRVDRDKDLRE